MLSERTATCLNKLIIHYTKLEAFTDTKGVLLTETTKCKKDQKG